MPLVTRRALLSASAALASSALAARSTPSLARDTEAWLTRPRRSIAEFGAVPGGQRDCTRAFTDAAHSGEIVNVPEAAGGYLIEGQITDDGACAMLGLGRPLLLAPARGLHLKLTGKKSVWSGFRIRTSPVNNAYQIELSSDASENTISDIIFEDANSGIRCRGARNRFEALHWVNANGQCMRFEENASANTGSNLSVCNGNQGLILCERGSKENKFKELKKYIDPERMSALSKRNVRNNKLGADAFACVTTSYGNTVTHIYCADMKEGGITATGDRNSFSGGTILRSGASGINLGGSENTADGFAISGCKTGISFTAQAGGLGRDNRVSHCTVTDSLEVGFRAGRWAYRLWEPGPQDETAPTAYCYFGQNLYRTRRRATMFGTTAPTHESGTVSDGLVEWTFLKRFSGRPLPTGNLARNCSVARSGKVDWLIEHPGTLERS